MTDRPAPETASLRSRERWLRHLAVRMVTLALAVAGTLVCLEIFVFAFEPQLARFFQYDEELGFRVKPYSEETNQFGFRDVEYPPYKAAGTFRILCVGDSFGWQGGLRGNYTALLERLFEREYGTHRVDVINVGYPMTTTSEQLRILRRYGMGYHPDLVVLGFFAGNDFVDADPNRRRIVLMDTYFDIDSRHPPPTMFGRPLVARSRLRALVSQRASLLRELLSGHTPGSENGSAEEAYVPMTGGQMNFYDVTRHARGEYAAHVETVFQAVDEMQTLVAREGARFAVAIFPADFSVHPERAERIFQAFRMNPADFDLALAQKLLQAHLVERHISTLDLLPEFVARGRVRRLYLPRDGHWNSEGNAAAAQLLYEWLRPGVASALDSAHRQ